MDRATLSSIAHRRHAVAAPVSETNVERLLAHLNLASDGTVVDLGCGPGAWLRRLKASCSDLEAVGVDVVPHEIHPADPADPGISWVTADAASWQGPTVDGAILVGVEHVFGGLAGVLEAAKTVVNPGGRALVGISFWEAPPTDRAISELGMSADALPDLATAVRAVRAAGFEVIDGHVSTVEEWDDYEWSWSGALIEYGLSAEGSSADRAQAVTAAQDHRSAWLDGYRGVLGFVTFVLAEAA